MTKLLKGERQEKCHLGQQPLLDPIGFFFWGLVNDTVYDLSRNHKQLRTWKQLLETLLKTLIRMKIWERRYPQVSQIVFTNLWTQNENNLRNNVVGSFNKVLVNESICIVFLYRFPHNICNGFVALGTHKHIYGTLVRMYIFYWQIFFHIW